MYIRACAYQVLVWLSTVAVCGVVGALWGVAATMPGSWDSEKRFLFLAAGFGVLVAAWFVLAAFTLVGNIRNGFFMSPSESSFLFGLPLIFVQRTGTLKVRSG
jgi:hypothetical protein